jgi:hypothetical protein
MRGRQPQQQQEEDDDEEDEKEEEVVLALGLVDWRSLSCFGLNVLDFFILYPLPFLP